MATTVKVTNQKSRQFEHAVSMSKQLVGSVYIGNIICYTIYLPTPFLRGLEVYLEGGSIFLVLMLSIDIYQ